MFNGESVISSNPEFVWARYSASLRDDQQCAFPIKKGGWNNECVTQKVIDAYRMADGHTIDNRFHPNVHIRKKDLRQR